MKKIFSQALAFIKQFFHLQRGEKINIEYPVSWDTMCHEDFRNVCSILTKPHGKKEALFLCLCALAHIRPDNPIKYDPKLLEDKVVFLIGGKSYIISPKVIQEACSQLEFIYDSIGLPPSPLPGIDRKIYGISFEKFYEADAYILRSQFDKGFSDKWLKEAAKVLTNGRIRKLLDWQKQGLVIWWNGVKQCLKVKYPYVFEDGDNFTDRTQEEILQELLSCMNDNKPQNNDAILKSDVHSVLFSLNKIYENAKRR